MRKLITTIALLGLVDTSVAIAQTAGSPNPAAPPSTDPDNQLGERLRLASRCPYLLYLEILGEHHDENAAHHCCLQCDGVLQTDAKYPRESRRYPRKGDTHETCVITIL